MTHPDVQIVAELVGGTTVAAEIIDAAIANRKSVVTANKELMAACGPEIWDRAIEAGINLAMEASVCGGIPIHAVLREGISGDRVVAFYGILNGTCNYILTEMEKRGATLETVLAEAQRAGLCRSRPQRRHRRLRRALEAGDAGGPGLRRENHALGHLHGGHPPHHAARFPVRAAVEAHHPADLRRAQDAGGPDPLGAAGADPAVHHSGRRAGRLQRGLGERRYGEDTFYYGWGAGSLPTGVAVVSDLMRVAREIRSGSPERVSPFAHERLGEYKPVSVTLQKRAYYLRFRVKDRPGIIAGLAGILAHKNISLEAVLQEPCEPSTICRSSSPSSRPPSNPSATRWRRWPSSISCGRPPLALPMETAL